METVASKGSFSVEINWNQGAAEIYTTHISATGTEIHLHTRNCNTATTINWSQQYNP